VLYNGNECGKTKAMKISFLFPFQTQIMVDQKQPKNLKYFSYLSSMITNVIICTSGIKSRTFIAKAGSKKKKAI